MAQRLEDATVDAPARGLPKKRFVIALPKEMQGIPGYADIPKIGVSTACSPRGAISNYLWRVCKETSRIIIRALEDRDKYGGAESRVFELPVVEAEDKRVLDLRDRQTATEVFLADKLAERYCSNNPLGYLDKAREIVAQEGEKLFREKDD